MMEFIRNWILGLAGAAVFCAVATELTPKGPVKAVLRCVCGVVMAGALLSPLLDFDFPAYSLNLARYRASAAEVEAEAAEISGALNRRVIEEALEAYILDKAQTLGTPLADADVTARWSTEGVWAPVAAELNGRENETLSGWIEAELGIPREAQTWNADT